MSYKKDMPRKERALLKMMGWQPEKDMDTPPKKSHRKKHSFLSKIDKTLFPPLHDDTPGLVGDDDLKRSGRWWAVIFFALIAIFTAIFTLIGKYLT